MKTVAIIPSAGRGVRMGANKPKQFLLLQDRPILYWTLMAFEACLVIDEIILVVPESEIESCQRDIVEKYELKKVSKIVPGGLRRQDSVGNGFHAIEGACDVVCIHDGVRPFIANHLIERAVRTARNFGGSIVAVRVTDTIKQITDDGFVQRTPNRRYLYAAQTPQCFDYNLYADALAFAEKEHLEATDDSFLVESVGGRVVIVEGSYDNIKITNPNDLAIGETILSRRS